MLSNSFIYKKIENFFNKLRNNPTKEIYLLIEEDKPITFEKKFKNDYNKLVSIKKINEIKRDGKNIEKWNLFPNVIENERRKKIR